MEQLALIAASNQNLAQIGSHACSVARQSTRFAYCSQESSFTEAVAFFLPFEGLIPL